jgi:hypothetical protein
VIGLIVLGSLRESTWDWKLLYRIAGKTILEHTISLASEVEVAHKIIVCLDYKDMPHIHGTAFSTSSLNKSILQTDERIKLHFSDKSDWIGKVYEACIKHSLTSICIINADSVLIPPGLIKECIMKHMLTGQPVRTSGYPAGIEASVMPFYTLANLYRYRDHHKQKAEVFKQIPWTSLINTNDGPYYIYNGIEDLRFANKSNAAMLEAFLTDIAAGADLSNLLQDWHEQE